MGHPLLSPLFLFSVATCCASGRKGYLRSSHCLCGFCQAELWISRLPFLSWWEVTGQGPDGSELWHLEGITESYHWTGRTMIKGKVLVFSCIELALQFGVLLIKDCSVFFVTFIRSSLINWRVHSYPGISFAYLFENKTLQGTWLFLSKLLNDHFMLIFCFIWDNFALVKIIFRLK